MSVMNARLLHVSHANESLLLIDGHSLAYRAFHALPAENFATSTGQTTNAIFGFISMLINVLRDEAPSHGAVAFDLGRETFRLEEYAESKAGRRRRRSSTRRSTSSRTSSPPWASGS